MTSVSAAYPTENSRVWFSCDPSQKQFFVSNLPRHIRQDRIDLDAVNTFELPSSHGSHQENSLGLQNFLEGKGLVVWHLWPSVVA